MRGTYTAGSAAKPIAALLLAFMAFGTAACSRQDWRTQAIAAAEDKMRLDVKDPTAQFSRIQITGDDTTGQACGFVRARSGATGIVNSRFIVYIDGTAGPYIERNLGTQHLSQDDFAFAWQNDCLNEGYKS